MAVYQPAKGPLIVSGQPLHLGGKPGLAENLLPLPWNLPIDQKMIAVAGRKEAEAFFRRFQRRFRQSIVFDPIGPCDLTVLATAENLSLKSRGGLKGNGRKPHMQSCHDSVPNRNRGQGSG